MNKILLTAFPRWEGESYNSSLDIINDLSLDLPDGWQSQVQCLPGTWEGAPQTLQSAITPDVKAVVCFGMTGGSTILVERIATNLIIPSLPDIDGNPRTSEYVCRNAPPAYWTTLPFRAIIDAVSEQGISCAQSLFAGEYLCNYIFYWLMHYAANHRPDLTGGFVHVPPFEMHGGITKSEQCVAASIIAKTVIAHVDKLV